MYGLRRRLLFLFVVSTGFPACGRTPLDESGSPRSVAEAGSSGAEPNGGRVPGEGGNGPQGTAGDDHGGFSGMGGEDTYGGAPMGGERSEPAEPSRSGAPPPRAAPRPRQVRESGGCRKELAGRVPAARVEPRASVRQIPVGIAGSVWTWSIIRRVTASPDSSDRTANSEQANWMQGTSTTVLC